MVHAGEWISAVVEEAHGPMAKKIKVKVSTLVSNNTVSFNIFSGQLQYQDDIVLSRRSVCHCLLTCIPVPNTMKTVLTVTPKFYVLIRQCFMKAILHSYSDL